MNISTNLSSIQNSQSMMNTTAKNIANPKSNSDLTKDVTNQIVAQDSTALNTKAIKTQDEMLGSLLDIKV